jgi:hypothetical protein
MQRFNTPIPQAKTLYRFIFSLHTAGEVPVKYSYRAPYERGIFDYVRKIGEYANNPEKKRDKILQKFVLELRSKSVKGGNRGRHVGRFSRRRRSGKKKSRNKKSRKHRK